jgi:hypothetical protein
MGPAGPVTGFPLPVFSFQISNQKFYVKSKSVLPARLFCSSQSSFVYYFNIVLQVKNYEERKFFLFNVFFIVTTYGGWNLKIPE